ncbi:metal ABC transporter substrate-binding protein [Propionibacteriaceae bacterium Y1685]|uniref:metal ABC transporter substrate-binding protein n=1 Tax=Microlunatus sp. Y1700 TaxID=3418487 RepID=UPI003B7C6ABB
MLSYPRALGAALVAGSILLTAACGSGPAGNGDADPGQVSIVTAFYPLQFVSERIAGAHGHVTSLTQPGTEPHDLELTPKQVGSMADADLVVYEKSFQAAVDTAVEQSGQTEVVDVAAVVPLQPLAAGEHDHEDEGHDHEGEDHDHEGEQQDHDGEAGEGHAEHDHGDLDPHVWLDPSNMVLIAEAVTAKLVEADPDHAADYRSNLTALTGELNGLDQEFAHGLQSCERKEFVVSHAAFGYLARKYGLTQIGISGLSPDAEPSPARIAAVHEEIARHDVTTIFYETLVSPAVAESIAKDLGLTTAVLDPLEGLTGESAGEDYVAVMRSNLTALRTANGCR